MVPIIATTFGERSWETEHIGVGHAVIWRIYGPLQWFLVVSESESEMFLFDPYQKYIQSNNETILDQGTPIKTSLVANIRAAYYIINNYFFISQAKNT